MAHASPTTSCSTDAVELAAAGAALPRDLAASVKATLREAPWQPDFESAVQTELGRQQTTFAQGGGSARWRRSRLRPVS